MSITLPAVGESVLCSDFAREQRIDPRGSGLAPDVLVVVEVPEPWPKPVRTHPELVALCRAGAEHPERVRLLAAVPHDPDRRRVIAFRPAPGGMTRAERELGGDSTDAMGALRAVMAAEPATDSVATAARTVLICTQGSHDVCCGTRGADLAERMAASDPELELFRVSHTGGHRFAPTAMTLPDGRMWAYLDEPLLAGILDRSTSATEAAPHCRGWWGARGPAAQVAEAAVLAEVGWDLDRMSRSTRVVGSDDEGDGGRSGTTVTVDTEVGRWMVAVEPGRLVATVTCGAPGGLPAKQAREWKVVGLDRRSHR